MPVDIEGVLREGVERTLARNGLVFAVILFVIQLFGGLVALGTMRGMLPPEAPWAVGAMPNAPSLGLTPVVAGVLSLALALASIVVTVGATRTFVGEETERIPRGSFTRNIVLAVLNLVVGGIAFGLIVAFGFVLLVVPGLFLLVSLFFWNVYVIVEDQNFVEGLRNSWGLTRGHRWRLFALGIVVVIIAAVVNAVFGIPGAFLPPTAAFVVAQIGSALASVFFTATVARTYRQLTVIEARAVTGAEPEPTTT